MPEKFVKKSSRRGMGPDEPVELTEVIEEASEDDYVRYGTPARGRAGRSLIDIEALEDVAVAQARRAVGEFLAEHGAEILGGQAREVLVETARKIGPTVAEKVFREKAGEAMAGVAEEVALEAAREAFQAVAAEVMERVAREMLPKVVAEVVRAELERTGLMERVAREVVPEIAERIILGEIEKLKASVRQGLT